MKLPVTRSEQFEEDLYAILQDLDTKSAAAADRLVQKLAERTSWLGGSPITGRDRGDLSAGLRSFAIENHVVFFRVTSAAVILLRILHSRRDTDTMMKDYSE